MGRKPGNSKTVAGLLASLGLVVPVAALPACDTNEEVENDVGIGTENPPPIDVSRFDAPPIVNPPPDFGVPDGPIGTENPAPPDFGPVEEDAPLEEDAPTDDAPTEDDAGEDGAG